MTDDTCREQILRFLYQRHKGSRGIRAQLIGIQDLQRELKTQFQMGQSEVSHNLDYLIQVGWVRKETEERSFQTRGMQLSRPQVKYKISDVGINHLEAGTIFQRPLSTQTVNITNVQGVTVVGNGNVVNTKFADLSRALDELDRAISTTKELTDEEKLDAGGDLATIRAQVAKKNPSKALLKQAWDSLNGLARIASLGTAVANVAGLLERSLT